MGERIAGEFGTVPEEERRMKHSVNTNNDISVRLANSKETKNGIKTRPISKHLDLFLSHQ